LTKRELLSKLITEARAAIRAMVHVSPMDAENAFKTFTHVESLTGTPYNNPNRLLAALWDKYSRCTEGEDRHVGMTDFLDLAVWCLNQLQPAFHHPWHGDVEALGRRVYRAMGNDVFTAATIKFETVVALAIAQWNHGTTLLRTNPGQPAIVPPVVWQQHPWAHGRSLATATSTWRPRWLL
jgi:hypothetical protein